MILLENVFLFKLLLKCQILFSYYFIYYSNNILLECVYFKKSSPIVIHLLNEKSLKMKHYDENNFNNKKGDFPPIFLSYSSSFNFCDFSKNF